MSEKQAKKKRKEQDEVLAEYGIRIMRNGDVAVSGPIDNLMGFFDATNRAQRVVLDQTIKNMRNMQSNIIVPKLDMSKIKLI